MQMVGKYPVHEVTSILDGRGNYRASRNCSKRDVCFHTFLSSELTFLVPESVKKNKYEDLWTLDPRYYGMFDEEDGTLIEFEQEREMQCMPYCSYFLLDLNISKR